MLPLIKDWAYPVDVAGVYFHTKLLIFRTLGNYWMHERPQQ
jgi:hypothetical protein